MLLDLLKTYKLYLYAIAAAAALLGILYYGHTRYMAGVSYCIKQQNTAQSEYTQGKEKKNEQEKQAAVNEADKAAKRIADLEHEKQLLLSKLDDNGCALTDYERLQFNEALNRIQGQ